MRILKYYRHRYSHGQHDIRLTRRWSLCAAFRPPWSLELHRHDKGPTRAIVGQLGPFFLAVCRWPVPPVHVWLPIALIGQLQLLIDEMDAQRLRT